MWLVLFSSLLILSLYRARLRLQMYCFFLIYANFPAIFDILRLLYSQCFIFSVFYILRIVPTASRLPSSNQQSARLPPPIVGCLFVVPFSRIFARAFFLFLSSFPGQFDCPPCMSVSLRRMYICPSRRIFCVLIPNCVS